MIQSRFLPKVLVVLSGLLTFDAAFAGEARWYVGAGLGDVSTDYRVADFQDGSVGEGITDNSDSSWKVFVGYWINSQFAIEVAFADLHNDVDRTATFSGSSDGSGDNFDSLPGGDVSVDFESVDGIAIETVGAWPLASRLVLNAKAGVFIWEARKTTMDLRSRDDSLNGTSAILGAGLEYRFESGIAVRGDIERYLDVATADHSVVGASILFRF